MHTQGLPQPSLEKVSALLVVQLFPGSLLVHGEALGTGTKCLTSLGLGLSRAVYPNSCPSLLFTSCQTFFFLPSSKFYSPSSLSLFQATPLHPISMISILHPPVQHLLQHTSVPQPLMLSPHLLHSAASLHAFLLHQTTPLFYGGTFWSVFQCVLKTDLA